jgi:DNA-binding transcriptional regulator YiaG
LDKPKVGSPKPEKPNVGRDFVGPALAVRVIGGEEAAEQVSRAKRTEEKKEESAMATEKPTVNWLEIQEVRNSGKFTIKQIAKNFGVEEWQVYQKTKSPNRSIAKDLANLPSNNGHATDALPYIAATPTVTAKNGDGKSRKQITLEELREMRDSLNHAISMVERGTASGV